MTRIICFDHLTTATTPLVNQYMIKRTSYNYEQTTFGTRVDINKTSTGTMSPDMVKINLNHEFIVCSIFT